MNKKQRLSKLLTAADRLLYNPGGRMYGDFQTYSCNAVHIQLGETGRVSYDKAVGANASSRDLIGRYDERSQLARQLAVLMYREGIKRGKYE